MHATNGTGYRVEELVEVVELLALKRPDVAILLSHDLDRRDLDASLGVEAVLTGREPFKVSPATIGNVLGVDGVADGERGVARHAVTPCQWLGCPMIS